MTGVQTCALPIFDDVFDSFTGGTYQDKLTEVAQNHVSEDIFTHRVVTESEYLELFDRENDYLKDWTKDKKLEFIFDSLENRNDRSIVRLSDDC